ncbi:hypothetical protein D030_4154B, partial [Vibrio parahaemolyticus AQ3810]
VMFPSTPRLVDTLLS